MKVYQDIEDCVEKMDMSGYFRLSRYHPIYLRLWPGGISFDVCDKSTYDKMPNKQCGFWAWINVNRNSDLWIATDILISKILQEFYKLGYR